MPTVIPQHIITFALFSINEVPRKCKQSNDIKTLPQLYLTKKCFLRRTSALIASTEVKILVGWTSLGFE